MRGHDVTILEKSDRIGGRLNPGSKPGIKFDIVTYIEFMKNRLEMAEKEYGLKVKLNTEATPELIKKEKFDKVVVSAGTKDVVLPVAGVDKCKWYQAVDILEHPEKIKGAKKVVVIGGGVVGCETAFYLNKEFGMEATVVEMTEYMMNHTCTANRGYLLKYMYDAGVKLFNCTKLLSIEDKGVKVLRNMDKSVPNPYLTWNPILPENVLNPLAPKVKEKNEEQFIEADAVIMAAGGRPDENLFLDIQQKCPEIEVYNIGDSFKGGKVFEATKSGYSCALNL